MISTASDVASLARELWWWEHAEYVFAALVAIACFGEYLAEFSKCSWIVEHKDGMAKRSTLLLIAALSFELICLVKTNDISGRVIGSLRDKAEEADRKAKTAIADSSTALSQAKDALAKAGAAQESLGKAEAEAAKAETAALSALSLARNAREEAASFKKDILSAQKQAAEVFGQMLDREITSDQRDKMLSVLRTRPPGQIVVQSLLSGGRESLQYGNRIADVFRAAHWDVTPPTGRGSFEAPISGVFLVAGANSDDLADFLANVLIAGHIAPNPVLTSLSKNVKAGTVEIWVASREPMQKH
jgi:hypothetical protein